MKDEEEVRKGEEVKRRKGEDERRGQKIEV